MYAFAHLPVFSHLAWVELTNCAQIRAGAQIRAQLKKLQEQLYGAQIRASAPYLGTFNLC